MKKGNGADLLRVAEAITDAASVDWEREASTDEKEMRVLLNLQAIDRIGTFWREGTPQAAERSRQSEMDAAASVSAGETMKLEDTVAEISRWGSLAVVKRLGEGAYGEVFLAHDPALDIPVALKLLHPRRSQALFGDRSLGGEARNLARVTHANVVRVRGVDRRDGRVGIWSDYIEGKTLGDILRAEGTLAAAEAANIGIDLCRALAAVHGAGLIHGDIKASNVMRERGGRIVLMDFGCAVDRPFSDEAENDTVTGTPVYMAPELFEGRGVGVASDVYSMGVLLYHLVTGVFPVKGQNVREIRENHRQGDIVPLLDLRSDLEPQFVRIVERAMDPVPERRYRSAGEMERALSALRSPAAPPAELRRGRRWLVPLAATLVVAAALLLLRPFLGGGSFQVDASVFRLGDGVEERLLEGSRVAVGDQLFLEVTGSRDMYVYVLNEDEAGHAYLLFPLPGLDARNPLSGDETHRLPGGIDGQDNYWNVTSGGGVETFLVVAARDRQTDLEALSERIPRAGESIEVPVEEMGRIRGVGGLSPPAPSPGRNPAVSEIADRVAVRAANTNKLWLWEIRFANPNP